MTDWVDLLPMLVSWALVVALGAVLVLYSLRSYHKTHARAMVFLGAGFLFLSFGPAVMWISIYLISYNPVNASLGCAGMLALGFGAMIYALRTRFA